MGVRKGERVVVEGGGERASIVGMKEARKRRPGEEGDVREEREPVCVVVWAIFFSGRMRCEVLWWYG